MKDEHIHVLRTNRTAHAFHGGGLQVNLLDDHLVDVLLDSAAGGWNTVEREVGAKPLEGHGSDVGAGHMGEVSRFFG